MDEGNPSSPPPEENSSSKAAEERPNTESLCDNNNDVDSSPAPSKNDNDINLETKQMNDENAVENTNVSNGHSLSSAKSLWSDSSSDLPKSESNENLIDDNVKECVKVGSSEHNHCGESNDLPSISVCNAPVANNVGDSEKDIKSDDEDVKCKSPSNKSTDFQADCDLDKHDESLKSKDETEEDQVANHEAMEEDRISEDHEEAFRIRIESKHSSTTDELQKDTPEENINSDEIDVPHEERNDVDVELANADDKSDQSLSASKVMDVDVSSEACDTDNNNDDGNNPVFENAPEHNANDSQVEDTSQALDPFDQLFKDRPDTHKEGDDSAKEDSRFNDEANDLDNDADTTLPEDAVVNDVDDGKGADEEVCLLPDTEREISETDKQKALENKTEFSKVDQDVEASMQASNEAESCDVSTAPSGTDAAEEEDEEANEEVAEVVDESSTTEEKDESGEKTQDVNAIIEIFPVREELCVQCTLSTLCRFKVFTSDLRFLCRKECLKAYQEDNPEKFLVPLKKIITEETSEVEEKCYHCWGNRTCRFSIKACREKRYVCDSNCVEKLTADKDELYVVKWKKVTIQEIEEHDGYCESCSAKKSCKYEMNVYNEVKFVCSEKCIEHLKEKFKDRYKVKKKVVKKQVKPSQQPLLKLKVISNATDKYIDFGHKVIAKTAEAAAAAREDRERSFIRKCEQCNLNIKGDENNLSWETMDFCNETCLGKYQNIIGSKCANCKNAVNDTSLGKYCVRFGYDIRQFCCSGCLEEFKKGLKICCYCHRDISGGYEGFLAPVGEKGQFKDFCSQVCMQKFDQMSKNPIPQPIWAKCAVCSDEKPTQLEVALDNDHSQRLCSEPCFAAFKFVNSVFPDQCRWCKKYFERKSEQCYTIYTETATHCFCSKTCMNVYISNSRHIVPCNWCKVKKYNFDMIRRTLVSGQSIMMCSLNCLTLYQVSVNAVSSRRIKCDECKRTSQAQYHLTMSDATVRNFCTYQCVMSFQGQYTKAPLPPDGEPGKQAVPTGAPRRTYNVQRNNGPVHEGAATARRRAQQAGRAYRRSEEEMQRNNASSKAQSTITTRSSLPVISNVQSLAKQQAADALAIHNTRGKSKRLAKQIHHDRLIEDSHPIVASTPSTKPAKEVPKPPPKPVTPPPPPPPKIYNHILLKTLPPKDVANKATMTKPMMVTKGVSCRPHPCNKECQTDDSLERRVLIPVPVPIFVPVPLAMYSLPFPVPVPIPLPIPTPVFIPTTRNSANGILKEIKKIHEKMPTDPFEAELLMMAEMVAGDKKKNESDSETDDENEDGFSPDAMDGGNNFGEDMLQMALKMATEYDEPPVDLESAMTASTITPSSHPPMQGLDDPNNSMQAHHHHQMLLLEQQRAAAVALRGRKRPPPARAPPPRSKRRRGADAPPPPPEPPREPAEKPDANMCLKYTFGVNAWKQWVMTKNAEIEKSTIRRKPFKSEILQLTADELNYSLCLFVKEVRKPNGSEYAPDTIYYLVLGIQQYLFENGRIDNIFTDPYYEKFTECLDEVARKFSVLYNDSQYIVTRVEEEHLWESKQLGAHSPHVLLSTLMFFNTKHFNLVTVEEHMQLSFSHIMKHWKRNPNQPGAAKMPGSRNVLLRFYPPQSALEANSRKKKVYEQQENEENPLRCPVKLYEFYISKCPESVRTRNDVFYLMPERSCVPDSPVWYSTQALGREALAKMLHRVKMVKEINIALLTS